MNSKVPAAIERFRINSASRVVWADSPETTTYDDEKLVVGDFVSVGRVFGRIVWIEIPVRHGEPIGSSRIGVENELTGIVESTGSERIAKEVNEFGTTKQYGMSKEQYEAWKARPDHAEEIERHQREAPDVFEFLQSKMAGSDLLSKSMTKWADETKEAA